MSASLKLDKRAVEKLAARFDDPVVRDEIRRIPASRGIAAIVAEAIADNFNQQGPGWAPLKSATIRQSVSKAALKASKKPGAQPARQILRKSGLLFGSVTTPGVRHNIWKTEGTTLIWGTDLIYAGIHNHGGIINHPGTKKGFGIPGLKIPPHKIKIPQRKYLTIRDEWMSKITEFFAEKAFSIIVQRLVKGGGR